MSLTPVVQIVDDEEAVRTVFARHLKGLSVEIRTHASGESLLAEPLDSGPGCVLLDLRLNGMSGEEVYEALRRRGWDVPVIIVTGHGDLPLAVEMMKRGAFDFLQKPVERDTLLRAVEAALDVARQRQRRDGAAAEERRRWGRLSPRERQVARLVARGRTTKDIAAELHISPRTVEGHRAHIMTKCGADSLAELVALVLRVDAGGT